VLVTVGVSVGVGLGVIVGVSVCDGVGEEVGVGVPWTVSMPGRLHATRSTPSKAALAIHFFMERTIHAR